MLSTWCAMSAPGKYDVSFVIAMIVLLLIIDITLMVWAFYCLVDCHEKGLISIPMAILLGILLFVPAFGIVVPVGIIIYHAVYCKKQISAPEPSFMFF